MSTHDDFTSQVEAGNDEIKVLEQAATRAQQAADSKRMQLVDGAHQALYARLFQASADKKVGAEGYQFASRTLGDAAHAAMNDADALTAFWRTSLMLSSWLESLDS